MKIELLVARATLGGAQSEGDVVDVESDEARRMIEAGQARPVRQQRRERATKVDLTEKAAG